jgi:hypothetical protein
MPTVVGFALLALSALAAVGCGGKGERLKANATVAAAEPIDPCNLSETFEISQFGCTPGKPVTTGGNTYSSRCLDWDGTVDPTTGEPKGSAPSGFFFYEDSIVAAAASNQGHPSEHLPPVVIMNNNHYDRMPADLPPHCSEHADLYAFHLITSGEDVWGPQFGVKFTSTTDGPLPPFDVSRYEGFGFWIKKGTDHPEFEPTGTSLFVSLGDENSTSSDNDNLPPCNDKSNHDVLKCDPFGVTVVLHTDWRFVMAPFDSLKQRGYGVHQEALDLEHINQIKF